MAERAAFYISYTKKHGPLNLRGLFYAALMAGVPGIDKDSGARKVQEHVLELRRDGLIDNDLIVDLTRQARVPLMFDSLADRLISAAWNHRINPWLGKDERVEIWVDKDAMVGVLQPETDRYGVGLMSYRGFSSETFAREAALRHRDTGLTVHVLHFGDLDRAGEDAQAHLKRTLLRFGAKFGVTFTFTHIAVHRWQIATLGLPTRVPTDGTAAGKKWAKLHSTACELDAIPPDMLRAMVTNELDRFITRRERAAARLQTIHDRRRLLAIAANL